MSVIIHSATKNQIDTIVTVLKEVISPLSYYNETARRNELIKYGKEELRRKIDEDPESVLIAEENNQIVGFCLSRLDDMTIWLEWFGVSERGRRKGIGKQIIQHLESTAKKRDAHKIWCDCRTENMKSISLLSACGYTPLCTIKNHWYKQDFILWQKEIT